MIYSLMDLAGSIGVAQPEISEISGYFSSESDSKMSSARCSGKRPLGRIRIKATRYRLLETQYPGGYRKISMTNELQEAMMGLTWEKLLSVGNAVIDSDHRNLIGMVNDVEHAIRARDHHAISRTFKSLEHWLCIHFANEEKIARAVNFDFSMHKPAQQYSLKELQYLRGELVAKKGIWSVNAIEHYSSFLNDWMVEHIIKVDMPMKPMLLALDYKFWPGCKEGETNHAAGSTASLYLKLFDAPAPCPA